MPETPPGFSPWTPDGPGKGLLIHDRLFEWTTDEQGAPHHKDALAALGITEFDTAQTVMFALTSEGRDRLCLKRGSRRDAHHEGSPGSEASSLPSLDVQLVSYS